MEEQQVQQAAEVKVSKPRKAGLKVNKSVRRKFWYLSEFASGVCGFDGTEDEEDSKE